MNAFRIAVALKLVELPFQDGRSPEPDMVEKFTSNRSDQTFDERMRYRRTRHRLDLGCLEDAQVRLPLLASEQWVVVGTWITGRRHAAKNPIEHPAQDDSIHVTGVNAKADDAPCELVHHHEHPVAF